MSWKHPIPIPVADAGVWMDLILPRVSYDHGCWLWSGHLSGGYGNIKIAGRSYRVHRIAYTAIVERDPHPDVIDHLCRNRACCNPLHMEVVTVSDNTRRGIVGKFNGSKTHCRHGHAFDDQNTRRIIGKNGTPERVCRECLRLGALQRRRAA